MRKMELAEELAWKARREELEALRGLFGEEDGFTSDTRGEFYYWLARKQR